METKHTPGEWKIEYPIAGNFIIHADGLAIASIHLIDDRLEEQEANAKLFYASRELLETLNEIENYINSMGVVSIAMQNIKSKCKKAIEKATK